MLSADVQSLISFSDEMSKIAEESPKKLNAKKWLKNTALVAAGTGAGTGAGMLAEALVRKNFPNVSVPTKTKLLSGLAGGATMGGMLLKEYVQKRKNEMDRE